MKYTVLFLFLGSHLFGQITFSDDIAPLIYEKCGTCHRPGEIGPFDLTSYEDVVGQGQMIKYVTSIGYMPPWKPNPEYSNFLGESFLTQEEIDLIGQWVDEGMERGEISNEPPFPNFPVGSLLGVPDLVLSMSEAHLHRGNNRDSYYYFVLPTGLTEDRIVKAVEFRPGNAKIVHHALIFEDTQGIARATDAQTPEYGFPSFGSFNGNNSDITFIEGNQYQPYAPGQKALRYPDGMGRVMSAGSDLAIQIHYAPVASDEMDQSSVNIFFADESEEIDRIIDHDVFLPTNLDGGELTFFIPGGTERTFVGRWVMPEDRSLIGIFPHSHLLGRRWEAYIEHVDGSRTNLIEIPEWDFNWQSQYFFNRIIRAEMGATIVAEATYDNTSNNPNNPSNPPQFVTWGENTTDEMYYMPFDFVPFREGDEDVIFDPTTSTEDGPEPNRSRLLPLYPNPVEGRVKVDFYLAQGQALSIAIFDIEGRLVRTLRNGEFYNTGMNSIDFRSENLANGQYIIQLRGEHINLSDNFVKAK